MAQSFASGALDSVLLIETLPARREVLLGASFFWPRRKATFMEVLTDCAEACCRKNRDRSIPLGQISPLSL